MKQQNRLVLDQFVQGVSAIKTVGAYEAKTHLPQLLESVAKGEQITITKHGIPVATLHGPSTYDASYLDLAMRYGLPLSTRDESILRAAKKSKVPIYKPAS